MRDQQGFDEPQLEQQQPILELMRIHKIQNDTNGAGVPGPT